MHILKNNMAAASEPQIVVNDSHSKDVHNEDIQIDDIESFFAPSSKKDNDKVNKKREKIVVNIINKSIPDYYFKTPKWSDLKRKIHHFLSSLCEEKGITLSEETSIVCRIKGGRKTNYDFEIIINHIHIFKIEWKYGAEKVIQTPQFYSPCKPSKYLPQTMPFEEWYYDNYLDNIVKHPASQQRERPNKQEYIKTINNNEVPCMSYYSELYKKNNDFKDHCKKEDKKAIRLYIQHTYGGLDFMKLSQRLIESQNDKIYMLCKNGNIKMEKVNPELYQLTEVISTTNTDYICGTKTGMKVRIKLRFKNGCGLKFPAFQIDRLIPKVKELKELCDNHQPTPLNYRRRVKKDELMEILDNAGVIY